MMSDNEPPQSLLSHFDELKKRVSVILFILLAGTIISYAFVAQIFDFLIQPLAQSMGDESTNRLIYTHLAEGFLTSLKLSFYTSLYITLPFLFIQIWRFVAPGLYKKEKNRFAPFFIATPLLFYLGGAVVYYLVMPLAWEFFLSFQTGLSETSLPIQLEARISDYLNMIIIFVFAFGISFEIPVLLILLGRAGVISADGLRKKRKYAVLAAFAFGAFLTPPDVISQITLASAILILYEISILCIGKSADDKKPS